MPKIVKHNFKELLDSCQGRTPDLIKDIAKHSGLTVRTIHLLYKDHTRSIKMEAALKFIEFFNQNRHGALPKLKIDDLFTIRYIVSPIDAKSKLKLG